MGWFNPVNGKGVLMKKKLIMIFTLILSLMLIIPVNNVTADAGDITLVDWSDFNTGVYDETVGDVTIWRTGGSSNKVYDGTVLSGTKYYGSVTSGTTTQSGWINFSDMPSYVNSIHIPFYVSCYNMAYQFFDLDFYLDDELVLSFDGDDGKLYINHADDSQTTGKTITSATPYTFWINITHIDGNTMNYSIDDTYFEKSSKSLNDWTTFDQIYVRTRTTDAGYTTRVKLGDIVINTQSSESGQGENEDLLDYDYIGCTDCMNSGLLSAPNNKKYIEWGFFVPMTKTITALDLLIGTNSFTSLNNYELYVNEQYIGNPSVFIENSDADYPSILRWTGIDVELDNEMPYFEAKSSTLISGLTQYWNYAYNGDWQGSTDCDGDGYTHVFTYNDVSYYSNGFDGITDSNPIYEPCYIMYYESGTQPPDNDVNNTDEDSITLNGKGYAGMHPSYDIKTFFQNTSVLAHIEAYDLTYDRYIYFYDDDYDLVGQTQYVSPYIIQNKYHDVVPFVPYNTGNYTVTVERNGVETANKSFYVYANTNDFQLWSVPSITQFNEQYQLHYIYSHSSRDGFLALFHDSDTNDFNDAFLTWDLNGNDVSGYLTYTPTSFNLPQYWQLFSYNEGVYYPIGSQYRHLIETSDDVQSYLYGSYDTIDLTSQAGRQRFHYGHDYLGADIWIFINNAKSIYIGDSQFSPLEGISYDVGRDGIYNCDIRVNINGTWYEISDTDYTFIVSGGGDGSTPSGGDDFDLFPEVSNTLGMIIGLIVTVFMTLSPFILAGSIGGNIQVPPVLYAVMGSLGVIVSTSFGWFPSYVLFFIIAVGIIVLALMYVMKMKGE